MPNTKQIIKRVLLVLGLLGVNVLVKFAATLTLILFFFRGDPILAALPAILVLPAILLQPWALIFEFAHVGFNLAPILTTVLTVFVYWWLNSQGKLEAPRRFLSRFRKRRALVLAGGFVALIILVGIARSRDFPALNYGLPPSVQLDGLNIIDSRYYCLGQFIDSEWVWQARVPASELARLEERLSLRPVGSDDLPHQFRNMPPYWWHPSMTEGTRVLSTSTFPIDERGPDGWYAFATWNPDDQMLHMWIKNNF